MRKHTPGGGGVAWASVQMAQKQQSQYQGPLPMHKWHRVHPSAAHQNSW